MDPRHGRLPADTGHHITRRHTLLRLRHLRSNGNHRYLHGRIGCRSLSPIPRYRNGAANFGKEAERADSAANGVTFSIEVLAGTFLVRQALAEFIEIISQVM